MSPRRKHSTIDLGPSASGRWTVCTASPQFLVDNCDKLPEERTDYADEGTLAHSVSASLLMEDSPLGEGVSPEMLGHVVPYVSRVKSHLSPGAVHWVERKVSLFYLPSRNGVVDSAVITADHIYIDDLKYGVGVSVDAEYNTQLAIYAESLIRSWEAISDVPDDIPVTMAIVQPRDRNNPEPVREWTLTRGELRGFALGIETKARDILAGRTEFVYSEKGCQFCPAKGFCSTYANQGLVALPAEARVIELPHPGALTREQRVKVIMAKKVLTKWLEAVEDQEVSELMNGAEPRGLKLVEGKSNRTWSDEDAAAKLLSNHLNMDDIRPRSPLVSPAAAEKLLKGIELSSKFKNKFQSLITKPEGKPTLVPEDDKRPALDFSPETSIQNIDVI